ncbi:MAG: tRNA (guanine(10)-N(2))-dimethyltransferase [Halobacteriales archaeon]
MDAEGRVEFEVDEDVFYNPRMTLNRDVTVAVLRAREFGSTYLDANCASGVRGLRVAVEAGLDVTLNDRSSTAVDVARRNVEANEVDVSVRREDANVEMHRHGYDVVDVDPFGSPMPFADAAFRSARNLACFTATDTAPLCGAHTSGVRRYGSVPLNTEYHAEMGLRVLVGALVRTAARQDVAATPVLSHSTDHYKRVYLSLERGAGVADESLEGLGYVAHCFDCLRREHVDGLVYDGPWNCCCGSNYDVAGPLWTAGVRDREFVEEALAEVSDYMTEAARARKTLERLHGELDLPTHYDQHVLCKRAGVPAASIEDVLGSLEARGYRASRTHYSGHSFKSDAPMDVLLDVVG